MAGKTVNLPGVVMAINGIPIGGFSDGDAATIEFNSDLHELTMGVDGEGMFNSTNDQSGTITFSMLYTSESNQTFQDAMDSGDAFSISIVDTAGGYEMFAATCKVMKRPSRTYSKAAGPTEWACLSDKIDDSNHGVLPG